MKTKRVLTAVLALFVLATVAKIALNASGTGASAGLQSASSSVFGPETRLVAYYLHGSVRCVTCTDIERSAKEALVSGFPEDLATGRVVWRVVNYEEAGNEHYAADFKLAAPAVVLASIREGQEREWKSLPEVWELIGDKAAFRDLIQSNVRAALERSF